MTLEALSEPAIEVVMYGEIVDRCGSEGELLLLVD